MTQGTLKKAWFYPFCLFFLTVLLTVGCTGNVFGNVFSNTEDASSGQTSTTSEIPSSNTDRIHQTLFRL
jgi:beta-lactamase class A